jgi:RNA recognition motif-containing protein
MYGGGGGGYGMRSQEQHEKQMRSVFIGNIPYNCTDDELKEIFARVGTVVNFK